MPKEGLLNYTTKIPADRTAAEIQNSLAKHGAKAIMVEYDSQGSAEALSFKIQRGNGHLGFRLPVQPDAVLRVLERQHSDGKLRSHQGRPTREQAVRVAWRIVKDWVEAQMAILETEMVSMEEVFLPYMLTPGDKTLFQAMVDRGFYLPEGKSE